MSDRGQTTHPGVPGALRAQDKSARRFRLLMAALAAALIVFDLVAARLSHLGSNSYFLGPAYSLLLLALALWYCRWRPLPRVADACELGICAVLFTNLLSVLIQVAGRSPQPLIDRDLMGLDARVHFETVSLVLLAARTAALRIPLAISYALTGPLVIVALLLPPLRGFVNASRRYVLGIVLAAILTAAAFAVWPAAGPWTTEGYAPTKEQAAVTAYIGRLKSPGPATLDMDDSGIVAFPSFHALLAILTAVALGSIRWLRIPAWALTVLVCISTLTTGWHYLVDVAGGIVLAIVTLCAVNLLLPFRDAQNAPPRAGADRQIPESS
ncbi:MAG: phosphatase PAP2 family protein [Terracidiphilus sp.]